MYIIDWESFPKYLIPISTFLSSYLAIHLAGWKKIREIKADLKYIANFKQIDLDFKRAEFIYTQKHNGYEDLLKRISKYSTETNRVIIEEFTLYLFDFNFEKMNLNDDEELLFVYQNYREKFSLISKKYNELYDLLTIEIQPSILNSSDEVFSLIEDLKNNYKLIFKKFTSDFLPKLTTLTSEEIKEHNSEMKTFFENYELSFEKLKTQMRKEIKEEHLKINL